MWQLWLFFSMCGMFYTLLNMRWVMEPVRFYGTPTFDSLDHTLVFVANRLFMAFMTIYVFPTSLIVCIGATVLIRRVLNYMARTDQITINLFDSDNCGGLSEFGLINALIMGIYFILLTNIVLNMQSHRSQTWMLVLPLIGMSIVIALQSVLAVYSIHGCVQAKKQEALTNVSRRLSNQLIDLEKSGYFPSDLLALRDHLLSVRTYPYSTYINGVVNLLRLSPALLGVARLVFR
ncbi:MAG: hypothetical protein JWM27_3843 [Gemmatimonadetes bacterium]|nr:hypothetical protein [Gemmatimonadota bacterium]